MFNMLNYTMSNKLDKKERRLKKWNIESRRSEKVLE